VSCTDTADDNSQCDDDEGSSNVSAVINAEDQPVQSKPLVAGGSTKRSKKSSVMKEEENALKVISSTLRQVAEERKQQNTYRSVTTTDDDCDVYGKFVAGELRAITDQYNRDLAKRRISDVLFQAKWQRVSFERVNSSRQQAIPVQRQSLTCPQAWQPPSNISVLEYNSMLSPPAMEPSHQIPVASQNWFTQSSANNWSANNLSDVLAAAGQDVNDAAANVGAAYMYNNL